jgi:hypothetical protein
MLFSPQLAKTELLMSEEVSTGGGEGRGLGSRQAMLWNKFQVWEANLDWQHAIKGQVMGVYEEAAKNRRRDLQ